MRCAHALRLGAAAALAVGAASGVHGYQTYAKWPTSTAVFYINPANADVSASAAIAGVQAGMNVWNNAGTPFRVNYGGTVSDTAIKVDNRNVVIFRPNYSSGSTIASTYTWRDSSNRLLDADVTFYTTDWTFHVGSTSCSGSRNIYIEDVAAHEFGHAIGVTHSNVAEATMYPSTSSCSQAWRTLSSDDIAGVRSIYGTSTSNTAPTVSISGPAGGASFASGASITFTGSASDTQDGNITSGLQWTDNGASIGQGGSFSRVLTAGTHTIVARATDSGGLQGSRQISVTVAAATATNTAPAVTISTPVNGASFASGATIAFSGSSTDTQDGNLSASLQWTDNGTVMGTGASLSRVLTAGTHTIVARSTDSGGLQGSRQISVTVASSSGTSSSTLKVTGRKVKGYQQADLTWNGLSATSIDVYRNNAKVMSTANDGAVTDPINKKGTATYTYKVCAVGTTTCSNNASVTF